MLCFCVLHSALLVWLENNSLKGELGPWCSLFSPLNPVRCPMCRRSQRQAGSLSPFLALHHLHLLSFLTARGFFAFPHHNMIRISPFLPKPFEVPTYAPDRKSVSILNPHSLCCIQIFSFLRHYFHLKGSKVVCRGKVWDPGAGTRGGRGRKSLPPKVQQLTWGQIFRVLWKRLS